MSELDTRPPNNGESVEARRLLHRRMTSALLSGDAEATSHSSARLGTGILAGVLLTIAVLAVVGIIAVLRPGGATAWQRPGAFIVTGETGTRYVYLDGVLSPVANYTSAKLLLGSDLHVVSVSARSLDETPKGPAIGIAMAPDSLPDAASIVGTQWSVCASGTAYGAEPLRATVLPGRLAAGEPVGTDQGFLLRTRDGGDTYLVWDDHAFPIADRLLTAVYPASEAAVVDDAFISALPTGPAIDAPEIQGVGVETTVQGFPSPVPVGRIFADRMLNYFVITQDGVKSLTPLQSTLLLADPRLAVVNGDNPRGSLIEVSQVAGNAITPLIPDQPTGQQLPSQAPTPAAWPDNDSQLCQQYTGARTPDLVIGPAEAGTSGSSEALVQLPSGAGAVVASERDTGNGTVATAVYLVTDNGVRYPISGQQSLERLGLATTAIATVPGAVLELLPAGPVLDVAAAGRPLS